MPSRWYNMRACADDRYLQSICAYRKPYFMIYIYEETKRDYKKYIKESNDKCYSLYSLDSFSKCDCTSIIDVT